MDCLLRTGLQYIEVSFIERCFDRICVNLRVLLKLISFQDWSHTVTISNKKAKADIEVKTVDAL